MKKSLAVSMLLLLSAAAASAQGLDWFKGTVDEAFAKAKAENKLVLLDFTSYT